MRAPTRSPGARGCKKRRRANKDATNLTSCHAAARHPETMKRGRVATGTGMLAGATPLERGRFQAWCVKPVHKLGPGPRHEPETVAPAPAGSTQSRLAASPGPPGARFSGGSMDTLYPCCAGIDVHKKNVVVCVRHAAGAKVPQEVRTFATRTRDLLALADWLAER